MDKKHDDEGIVFTNPYIDNLFRDCHRYTDPLMYGVYIEKSVNNNCIFTNFYSII